jgi:hypothetical protein
MPLEQLVVAWATYCTVLATLLFGLGAETQTPANPKLEKHSSTHESRIKRFMKILQPMFRKLWHCKPDIVKQQGKSRVDNGFFCE